MRKILRTIAPAMALTLSSCGDAGRDVETPLDKETVQTSADNPPNDRPDAALTLPPFPDYPAPVSSLGADEEGLIYFNTSSPYDFSVVLNNFENALPTTGKGTLFLPESASEEAPVPAMVLLHGSGGIKAGREFRYAELFADNGIAAFVVDYYEPRGVTEQTPYVMKTMVTTEIDVVTDAYSALKLLASHPAINAERIGVTGYSYGGMATRYALDARVKDIMAPGRDPFALHIDVYGPCHQDLGRHKTTGAPYLAVYGDNDNSVDPEACEAVQADIRANGSTVERHILPGAGHAWENEEPQTTFGGSYIKDCKFSFEPETGAFTINGESADTAPPGAGRGERAQLRAQLGALAAPCIRQGYLVGSDPDTDQKAKAIMLDFMMREFGLSSERQ